MDENPSSKLKRAAGRPVTGTAKSGAERQRAFAARRNERLAAGKKAAVVIETAASPTLKTRTWLRILADEMKLPQQARDWALIERAVASGLLEAEELAEKLTVTDTFVR